MSRAASSTRSLAQPSTLVTRPHAALSRAGCICSRCCWGVRPFHQCRQAPTLCFRRGILWCSAYSMLRSSMEAAHNTTAQHHTEQHNSMESEMYLPTCGRLACQEAAASSNSRKSDACQAWLKANGSQTPCRSHMLSSGPQRVDIVPASAALRDTTAASIKDDMKSQQLLG